ncbi:MAG TPA: tRNA (adenosine(37)-N6)-threonylcarbamoyltransferase complex dimerization subunit type 1 TsaB [Terriglobales bacterium]|jgi:tRNA threonylcarbamoyladenosine biosynthesis protein TsaB|nr:tRNA (adenosine(37)-N6)-threonylcarbamoyltransferase complex dimerization subunit type 1 TsaB [Terriglobales bacterium]
MLILGVDTSGRDGSIALVKFEQGSARTLEVVRLEGGTFSAQLVPQISDMLKRHGLTKRDLDGFAAVSGPGSFTGLRVGLAAIKALGEVLQKPVAAVSLLEAVARLSALQGDVMAALDAGRGEVYAADFQISGSQTTISHERLLTLAEFVSENKHRQIVTPEEKIAEFMRQESLRVIQIDRPRADFIARIGFEKIYAGEIIAPEALDANYIRRSDAEIKKPGDR